MSFAVEESKDLEESKSVKIETIGHLPAYALVIFFFSLFLPSINRLFISCTFLRPDPFSYYNRTLVIIISLMQYT